MSGTGPLQRRASDSRWRHTRCGDLCVDTPGRAKCHEILEESGYDINQLKILQPKEFRIKTLNDVLIHPVPIVQLTHGFEIWEEHYHTDTTYVFVTNSISNHTPANNESMNIKWVTLDELYEISDEGLFYTLSQLLAALVKY